MNRMKFNAGGQTLDGRNLFIAERCNSGGTGSLRPAVDQYGAGTALALAAAVFRSGEIEMLAQDRQQGGVGAGLKRMRTAVYEELE